MRTFHCCGGHPSPDVPCTIQQNSGTEQLPVKAIPPRNIFKRAVRFIKPLLPAFLLAIIPKCPFCLAAYVALGTGIGLSVTSARWLHITLLGAAIIPLSLFAAIRIGNYLYKDRLSLSVFRQRQLLFISLLGMLIGCSLLWLF
ncbi:hypothetical protein [Chitinophaga pinensis]|uniref:Uncharacterized protein n=1 Tax=Chitinophaga pinensis TaxID=79329 RepID=A0A5C6LTJ9_9BACT|nr:hypothetical protein [Chitinophaga pinensis]TWV98775.1 hypothetical protein FEF09_20340 [Chitinophaga pinensis]